MGRGHPERGFPLAREARALGLVHFIFLSSWCLEFLPVQGWGGRGQEQPFPPPPARPSEGSISPEGPHLGERRTLGPSKRGSEFLDAAG